MSGVSNRDALNGTSDNDPREGFGAGGVLSAMVIVPLMGRKEQAFRLHFYGKPRHIASLSNFSFTPLLGKINILFTHVDTSGSFLVRAVMVSDPRLLLCCALPTHIVASESSCGAVFWDFKFRGLIS